MRKKAVVGLLIAALSMGTLLGCQGASQEKEAPPQSGETQKQAGDGQEKEAEGDAAPNPQAEPETSKAGEITLPLTQEPVTLTVFAAMDSNLTGIINDYNENGFFQELEKRTGVHLEFVIPAAGNEKEAYNLMIASGELTDIITHNGYNYPEGLDAAVDDGYYLDLTPYLDTCLPDYNRVRTGDTLMEKSTVTDKGRVVGLHILYTQTQGPWMGMQIRKDWLDELGLEMPVTYDELEQVLIAFKEKKNAYAPLSLGTKGTMETSHALSAGYGVLETFQQVEGKVQYGPMEEGWKEYLTMLNRWYEEGLIDPDFMTNGGWQVDTGMVLNGETGVWNAMYTMISQYEADGAMEVVPMTSPVKQKGDALHIRREDGFVGNAVTISADCQYPEIALKLWNYLYSEEGSILANYGVEDDTFNYVDGKPQVSDKITANADYSMSQAQALYLMPPSRFGGLYDWTRELASVPKKDIKAFDIWGAADDSYIIPGRISYTSQESSERAKIVAEVTTYMEENSVKFITGVLDIETGWDTYVEELKNLGVERAIEITQDALDRFNER